MKKALSISLLFFILVILALAFTSLIGSKDLSSKQNNPTAFETNPPSQTNYTLKEVSSHNSKTDCWLLIDQKIYDVSAYIDFHPARSGLIEPFCGKDATKAFETMGRMGKMARTHSQYARKLLSNYYIANLSP